MLTTIEFNYIKRPPLNRGQDKIWEKAFNEYNEDHKDTRSLNMGCIPCYLKVYSYLNQKYKTLENKS